ncbi:hypothetical protein [Sphingobium yanoikuyae]|uniref:hypothetical protein n=1 Tax=Sphingobium yanoikuyae TaxID=13690 RepID=UPI0028A761C7|nr:hypothetical protein [Sphingobium yanoikuyae]
MALINDKVLQMRVSEDWLAMIDDWRRFQPDIPSRAEAIRRLVGCALAFESVADKAISALRNPESADEVSRHVTASMLESALDQ